jgi:tetraacyldisaccharide 4'-kinase
LREPLAAASAADALLTSSGVERLRQALAVGTTFQVRRALRPPRWVKAIRGFPVPKDGVVFAVAGVARPERFFDAVAAAGWHVAGTIAFRDHHRFTGGDIDRIVRASRAAGAGVVLTTEKDAVRFEACEIQDLPLAAVPLEVTIEPEADFCRWLLARIRTRHEAASMPPQSSPADDD